MSTSQISLWVGAAVLLFWSVGAYNRLVRLRNAILTAYAALDARVLQRNQRLGELARESQSVLGAVVLDAVSAALGQIQAARDVACKAPCDASAITMLGVAETVLRDARARVDAALAHDASAPGGGVSAAIESLALSDTALAFAREQFNAAANAYNHAVRQFPTRLLAALFGFGAGSTLPAGAAATNQNAAGIA